MKKNNLNYNLLSDNPSLLTSLTAHWKFDGNVLDSSGNGYNGTVIGCSPIIGVYGDANKAYTFDGSLSYISTASAVTASGAKSWCLWAKSSAAAVGKNESLIDNCGQSTTYHGFVITRSIGASTIKLWISNTTIPFIVICESSGINIWDNFWHFICFTWDGTTGANKVRCYIDGHFNSQATATGTDSAPGKNLWISNRQAYPEPTFGDTSFTGDMTNIRLYSRVLTDIEVKALYRERP